MKPLHLMLVLVVLAAQPAAAEALSPSLNITLTSQQPFPAEPGGNVEIEVEIQNNGQGEARDVRVDIQPQQPFSLLPGEEREKTLTLIGPKSSVKASYHLHVDGAAVTNTYDLDFIIRLTPVTSLRETVPVVVRGEPRLTVETVNAQPEEIEAGSTASLLIGIKNVGTGAARYLTVTLNATPEIIPILSEGMSYLGDLPAGGIGIASMRLGVDTAAEQKTYVMKLTAAYDDEAGNPQTASFDIGIPVTGQVRLDVIKVDVDDERGVLDIEVANKGTAEATSLEARLYRGEELVDIDYISELRPTKKTTFSFALPDPGDARLDLTYRNPSHEPGNLSKAIVIATAAAGSPGSAAAGVGVLVIALLVAGGLYVRRRQKRAHGKQSPPSHQ